jgi:hypothetical protein
LGEDEGNVAHTFNAAFKTAFTAASSPPTGKQRQKDKPVEAQTRRQKPSAASRRKTAIKDSVA